MNSVDCRNIEKETEANLDYRKVIKTVDGMQLVLMSLEVGETIPCEVHKGVGAQFIRIESGTGKMTANDKQVCKLSSGTSLLIPNGVKHCIENTSKKSAMKLYSVYTPQQHAPNRRDTRQPQKDEDDVDDAPRRSIVKRKKHSMKLRK